MLKSAGFTRCEKETQHLEGFQEKAGCVFLKCATLNVGRRCFLLQWVTVNIHSAENRVVSAQQQKGHLVFHPHLTIAHGTSTEEE